MFLTFYREDNFRHWGRYFDEEFFRDEKMSSPKIYISLVLMLLGITVSVRAHTMSPGQYLIWGLPGEEIEIPAGSVITEAVLTIHDIIPSRARFSLHLLDNTITDVQFGTQEQSGNMFDGFGIPLRGSVVGGKWICQLSKVNDARSLMWGIYGRRFSMTLADGSSVSFSSALLELMDYIGNGGGFGFGFDFIDVCTFTQMTLDITTKTYEGDYEEQVFSFPISQMYEYDPGTGAWIYLGGEGQSDWEADQDPDLPMTVSRCQVTAGRTIGQDTLTVNGTFNRVHPNLFSVSSIGVDVVAVAEEAVIYSEECGFTWDTVRNRFVWTYRPAKGEAGRITSLVLDFNARTYAIKMTNVDLTGLTCPIRFDITLGSYLLSGEADEPIVNGNKQIPIRLMQNYRDELRLGRVLARKGRLEATDQLMLTGEIALEHFDTTNLTTEDVVLTWGDQTFTIPAGSFTLAVRGNVYSCSRIAVPEGGEMTCRMDFDRCLFTIRLSKATLNGVTGTIEAGMQFADFNEAVERTL